MVAVLEFLTGFNWLILPETLIAGLRRANWRRAYARHGAAGIALETVASLAGTNSHMFAVPLASHWDGWAIERLLGRYGIEIWGIGFYNHRMFFHVRREDAPDAWDIMLRAGVDLVM